MKYLPGYEALSDEAIASARTLLEQERPTPRAAARIARKLWDRGYRRSDGGQYQQAPVLRALKAREWTHVIMPASSSALMASATVERAKEAASVILSSGGKQDPLEALCKPQRSASSTASPSP